MEALVISIIGGALSALGLMIWFSSKYFCMKREIKFYRQEMIELRRENSHLMKILIREDETKK